MKKLYRQLRKTIRQWWECKTKRCGYYDHYLAYGPADLTHIGWHSAERLALQHFKDCKRATVCPTCSHWEKALRA